MQYYVKIKQCNNYRPCLALNLKVCYSLQMKQNFDILFKEGTSADRKKEHINLEEVKAFELNASKI